MAPEQIDDPEGRNEGRPTEHLTAGQLAEIWACVRYATDLENEQTRDAPEITEFAPGAFAAGVIRHRLQLTLAPVLGSIDLPSEDSEVIARGAYNQRLAALDLARNTSEVCELLRADAINVIVLKGVALALQTTGDIGRRGSGDVDIWIDPSDLARAISSLSRAGIEAIPGSAPANVNSAGFRYTKWVLAELPMVRDGLAIDLHWWPNHVRGILPPFSTAWNRRQVVSVGGSQIATLGLADALTHSCAHAQQDDWYWLRSLVDVDRLSRAMVGSCTPTDERAADIQPTITVTHAVTRSPSLLPFKGYNPKAERRVVSIARSSQRLQTVPAPSHWSPRTIVRLMAPRLRQSRHPSNIARVLANAMLPPEAFVDTATGADLSFGEAVRSRLRRVVVRAAGGGDDTRDGSAMIRG